MVVISLATEIVQFATAKGRFWETRSPARSMYSDMNHLVPCAVAPASARHAAALEIWKLAVKVDSVRILPRQNRNLTTRPESRMFGIGTSGLPADLQLSSGDDGETLSQDSGLPRSLDAESGPGPREEIRHCAGEGRPAPREVSSCRSPPTEVRTLSALSA